MNNMNNFFNKNFLLLAIIASYLYPVYYIYDNFKSNKSISNIICDKNCQYIIFKYLMYMSFFLLLYEISRNEYFSSLIITTFVISSLLLVNIEESNNFHFASAFLAFLCLLFFTYIHYKKCKILKYLFIVQFVFGTFLMTDVLCGYDVFLSEALYLVNFGLYFFVLHCIS